jgi:hypothetical protein
MNAHAAALTSQLAMSVDVSGAVAFSLLIALIRIFPAHKDVTAI